MKFTLEIEQCADASKMIDYARMAVAAFFLRSHKQTTGFVIENGDTVAKWEAVEPLATNAECLDCNKNGW